MERERAVILRHADGRQGLMIGAAPRDALISAMGSYEHIELEPGETPEGKFGHLVVFEDGVPTLRGWRAYPAEIDENGRVYSSIVNVSEPGS